MFAMLGIGAFFLAGLLVSIRLLRLWRETHEWPELLAALGLLGIGPLGFCILMTGYVAFGRTPLLPVFRSAGLGIQALGFVAALSFTHRVFRPKARWAAVLTASLSLALVGTGVGMIVHPIEAGHLSPHQHADTLLKILALSWGAFESIRYWWTYRRRVALGYADPLVSASFLMWGLALGAGAIGFIVIYAAIASLGPGEHISTGVDILLSFLGLVSAGSLYLSFLPPHPYRQRIQAHAQVPGG